MSFLMTTYHRMKYVHYIFQYREDVGATSFVLIRTMEILTGHGTVRADRYVYLDYGHV